MADIIDIIHRLSYQVDDSELQASLLPIAKQIQQIDILTGRVSKLEKALRDTAVTDIERRTRIIKLINDQKAAIDEVTVAVGAQVAGDAKIQQSIAAQIGLMNELKVQLQNLIALRDRSNDPIAVQRYNTQIENTKKRMSELSLATRQGAVNTGNLGFAFSQITRELPSLAISPATFFLAISNNLPILIDQLNQIKAAGGGTKDVFRAIGQSIFSFNTLVTVAITLLSVYGNKLFDSGNSAKEAAEEYQKLVQSLQQIVKESNEANLALDKVFSANADAARAAAELVRAQGVVNGETFDASQKQLAADKEAHLQQVGVLQQELNVYKQIQERAVNLRRSGNPSNFTEDRFSDLILDPKRRAELTDQLAKINEDAALNIGEFRTKVANVFSKEVIDLNIKQNEELAKIELEKTAFIAKQTAAQYELQKSLTERISKLNDEENATILAGKVETTERIRAIINIQTEAELRAVNKQQEDAQKAGSLNAASEAQFARIRQLIRSNADIEFENKNKEFLRRLVVQEQDFNLQMQKMELDGQQAVLKILQDAEAPTLETRQRIAELQTDIALAENAKAYDAALEQARQLGENTEAIEYDFQVKEKLIIVQGKRAQIQAYEDYFTERLKLIAKGGQQEINDIQVIAGDIIDFYAESYEKDQVNYRKYRKEKLRAQYDADRDELDTLRKTAQKALDEAKAFEQRIKNDPNSNAADKRNAADQVNQARRNYTSANGRFLATAPQGSRGFETVFGDTARITDPEERRQKAIKQSIDAYQALAEAAVTAFQTIYQAQIAALDAEIQIRTRRVTEAEKLAERGNTEALRLEQQRLDTATRQREQYARREAAINSALAVSNAIVAVAEAASQSGAGAIAIVPAVIAAIIAGYAAISSATKESSDLSSGFYKGVIDLNGPGTATSDSIKARLSRGESVMTAETTAKYKPFLEAMQAGEFTPVLVRSESSESGNPIYKMWDQMNKRMDGVESLVGGITIKAENKMDGAGVHQLIETNTRIERVRFSG